MEKEEGNITMFIVYFIQIYNNGAILTFYRKQRIKKNKKNILFVLLQINCIIVYIKFFLAIIKYS